MLTESTENYLKAILQLEADKADGVSTSSIAERLGAQPASVTGMMHKLKERGWVKYERYKGVDLTEIGRRHAMETVRRHRLWETFLVGTLGFAWDKVHDLAEQLEHVRSADLTDQLDAFLGHPQTDPHGDPIPNADGTFRTSVGRALLSDAQVGVCAKIVGVGDSQDDFLRHLNSLGLGLGTVVEVKELFPFDRSMAVHIVGGVEARCHLSSRVTQNLWWVEAVPDA